MLYHVVHQTHYEYSRPVFLEPHLIRLHPRCDPFQRISDYAITITPEPAGISLGLDAENNPFHLAWFHGITESLQVVVNFDVETLLANPFNSFLTAGELFPLVLHAAETPPLAACLDIQPLMNNEERGMLGDLVREIRDGARHNILLFLKLLTVHLFEHIEKISRHEPGLQPIGQTLTGGGGSCRDTALVFIGACRLAGIPARFVSGCQEGDVDVVEADLHGWAEVYLPGFGWRGFDPTHGLAVADHHIVYAASAIWEDTAPLTGTFRGTDATATMSHQITMERRHR
jgi:transglutaminase-like putative cysteine protease